MSTGEDNGDRKLDCPVFVAESRHGWPRTCNNVKSPNMADLRRHLTKRPGRGYETQLPFLELCSTCNEDFIEKETFETRHGYKGELCNSRRPQRKGEKVKVQWELLYRQVEMELAVQHLSTRKQLSFPTHMFRTDIMILEQTSPDSALLQPLPTPQHMAFHDARDENDAHDAHDTHDPQYVHVPMEIPAAQPLDVHQDRVLPYATPYQLIFDSDSDKGDTPRETDHVSQRLTEMYTCLTDVASRHQCPPWMDQYIRHQATLYLPSRTLVRSRKDVWRSIPGLPHGPLVRLWTINVGAIPDQRCRVQIMSAQGRVIWALHQWIRSLLKALLSDTPHPR